MGYNRKRKKRTGPIESVDEFLARGGQINTVKADGRRYLSHEDRDDHNYEQRYDEMMQQRGFSQSVLVEPDVT